jgi:succinate dehydrogenase flavin-adding protein (antitoxin of CptAB toxin-antitoxin module)
MFVLYYDEYNQKETKTYEEMLSFILDNDIYRILGLYENDDVIDAQALLESLEPFRS